MRLKVILKLLFHIAHASHPESSTRIESPHKVESKDVDLSLIMCDSGLCQSIWDYSVQQRDKICRAYLKAEPY